MDHDLQGLQAALPERYTLEREIARTAMSRVYQARERHPDRAVVVKVLEISVTAHLPRERFLREIDLTSGLSHPHIVPIFAAGDADGALYYVMPLITGETLHDCLEREGRLSIDQALRFAQEIAGALHHAHGKDIIHRDIKPSNILLQEDHALVADFGIARVLSVADEGSLTQTGHAVGTPDYMSPEQVSAEGALDDRTDMYSLGCLLFEMLVGEPPFRSSTGRATLARHLIGDPGSIRARRPTVHPEIDGVVHRTLQKAPDDRFDSMEEFRRALGDAEKMASAAGSGRSSSSHTRWGWDPAHPRWGQSGIAAFLVVVAAVFAWRAWGGAGLGLVPPYLYADSVAVVPFENLTGDSENDRLGLGLADEIIHMLAQTEIKVIGLHSVETLDVGVDSVPQLLDDLGVRHLLEGSVDLDDGQVVVTTWHGDIEDEGLEKSDYHGSVVDWYTEEARVAEQIVDDFLTQIGVSPAGISASEGGLGREPTMLGNHWLAERTEEGIQQAIAAYEEAVELDRTYTQAYSGLSSAYALAVTYRYDVGVDAYEAAGLSLAYADRAIGLDSTHAAGFAARGYIRMLSLAPLSEAQDDFDRAEELQPQNPSIPSWYSRVLARQGDLDGALRAARRAVRLDPAHSGRKIAVALRALEAGLYEEVFSETAEVIELEPSLWLTRAIQGRALLLAGRTGECLEIPLGPHAVIRAMCLYEEGQHTAATAIVDSVSSVFQSTSGLDHELTHVARAEDLATYYSWIGDATLARDWMQIAYLESPTGIDPNVLGSALFDPVRNDEFFSFALNAALNYVWPQVQEARDSVELSLAP